MQPQKCSLVDGAQPAPHIDRVNAPENIEGGIARRVFGQTLPAD